MGADLAYTEFISSEGLNRNAIKSLNKLNFLDEERPIGIQLFGHDPDSMKKSAEIAAEAKPDLIDLNFGCPVRKVTGKGGGAALLLDVPRMVKITEEVVKSTSLPVTAKTRLGWDEKNINIVEVAERLQDAGIKAISIHGRTRAQLYGGEADWTLIGEVKKNQRMLIPVFGNGDIDSASKAIEYKQRYDVDGIMIGRAARGNPWIFSQIREYLKTKTEPMFPGIDERVALSIKHLNMSVECKGESRGVLEMRKYYGGYFKGIPDFKPYRMMLMKTVNLIETEKILEKISCSF